MVWKILGINNGFCKASKGLSSIMIWSHFRLTKCTLFLIIGSADYDSHSVSWLQQRNKHRIHQMPRVYQYFARLYTVLCHNSGKQNPGNFIGNNFYFLQIIHDCLCLRTKQKAFSYSDTGPNPGSPTPSSIRQ